MGAPIFRRILGPLLASVGGTVFPGGVYTPCSSQIGPVGYLSVGTGGTPAASFGAKSFTLGDATSL